MHWRVGDSRKVDWHWPVAKEELDRKNQEIEQLRKTLYNSERHQAREFVRVSLEELSAGDIREMILRLLKMNLLSLSELEGKLPEHILLVKEVPSEETTPKNKKSTTTTKQPLRGRSLSLSAETANKKASTLPGNLRPRSSSRTASLLTSTSGKLPIRSR